MLKCPMDSIHLAHVLLLLLILLHYTHHSLANTNTANDDDTIVARTWRHREKVAANNLRLARQRTEHKRREPPEPREDTMWSGDDTVRESDTVTTRHPIELERPDKMAVFGSAGLGSHPFASVRRRHVTADVNVTSDQLTSALAQLLLTAPSARLIDRQRRYYWAQYDNQLYWSDPYACRVQVNSDLFDGWTSAPAGVNSSGDTAVAQRPPLDTTITTYFICDGTCCDVDCCKVDGWKIVWKALHMWIWAMVIFWGSAAVYMMVMHRLGYTQSQPNPTPGKDRLFGGTEPWPQRWMRKRHSPAFWKRIPIADMMEQKLLETTEEDNQEGESFGAYGDDGAR